MSLYLALGDSITTGYGVGLMNSFASRLYGTLRTQVPALVYRNLGRNGNTTGHLAELLGVTQLWPLVSESTLITITIGSNDLLDAIPFLTSGNVNFKKILREIQGNLHIIGQSIRSLNTHTQIKIAALYNPLPATPFAGHSALGENYIRSVNDSLAHWAHRYAAELIPLDQIFKGREAYLLGPDGIHPNAAGHMLIAEAFFNF